MVQGLGGSEGREKKRGRGKVVIGQQFSSLESVKSKKSILAHARAHKYMCNRHGVSYGVRRTEYTQTEWTKALEVSIARLTN